MQANILREIDDQVAERLLFTEAPKDLINHPHIAARVPLHDLSHEGLDLGLRSFAPTKGAIAAVSAVELERDRSEGDARGARGRDLAFRCRKTQEHEERCQPVATFERVAVRDLNACDQMRREGCAHEESPALQSDVTSII